MLVLRRRSKSTSHSHFAISACWISRPLYQAGRRGGYRRHAHGPESSSRLRPEKSRRPQVQGPGRPTPHFPQSRPRSRLPPNWGAAGLSGSCHPRASGNSGRPLADRRGGRHRLTQRGGEAASRPATTMHPRVRRAAQRATIMPSSGLQPGPGAEELRSWAARRCRWRSFPAAPRRS
jgi:hypothetical protein